MVLTIHFSISSSFLLSSANFVQSKTSSHNIFGLISFLFLESAISINTASKRCTKTSAKTTANDGGLGHAWLFCFWSRAKCLFSTGLSGTPMASFAEALTEDQRWDVAAYVLSLRNLGPEVRTNDSPLKK